jgi:flagellar basal-body rod protein FlgF
MYQAGWSLHAASLNHELTAGNLAHATTPGYRRQGLSFAPFVNEASLDVAPTHNPTALQTYTSFAPGPLQQTENSFDLAVIGDAFFVLEGPNGPVYTRNGSFELGQQGELQAHNGMRVKSQGGTLTVPPGTARVTVSSDGVVFADGSELGRLQIARFDDPQQLRRVGATLFEGPAPSDPEPGSFRVEQGFREGANVDAIQEMISMMLGMRQYEAAEKALRALSEAISQNTQPQGGGA